MSYTVPGQTQYKVVELDLNSPLTLHDGWRVIQALKSWDADGHGHWYIQALIEKQVS